MTGYSNFNNGGRCLNTNLKGKQALLQAERCFECLGVVVETFHVSFPLKIDKCHNCNHFRFTWSYYILDSETAARWQLSGSADGTAAETDTLFLLLWLLLFTHCSGGSGWNYWVNEARVSFPLGRAHLSFSLELSVIIIRWIARNFSSPQRHPYDGVSDAHHHQRQHVDQNRNYDMIPGEKEEKTAAAALI